MLVQPVVQRRVGVGAHGPEAVARHQPGRPLGPLDGLGHGQLGPAGGHRLDRAEEVAGSVRQPLGEERLVEVGVGLDGGAEQDVAGEVDDVVGGLGAHVSRRRRSCRRRGARR